MAAAPKPGAWGARLLPALALLAALYGVTLVYALGEVLLAGTLLVLATLALWIYSSPRTYAFRYLLLCPRYFRRTIPSYSRAIL